MEFGSVRIRIIIEPEEGALLERFIEKTCELARFDREAFRKEHPGEPMRTNRFELFVTPAQGLTGPLNVLEAQVTVKKDSMVLFDTIVSRLSAQDRALLLETLPTRVDDEAQCFMRFDKKLFLNDVFALVDHGKCVHVTFQVLTYPKSRESAVRFLSEHLGSLIDDQ